MNETSLPKWVLIVAIAALILVPAALALLAKDKTTIWPVALACIAAVLLIRLPDVELFKVGPMEARLRRATEKAEATIEQLQGLAVTLSNPVLGSVAGAGRLGGTPRAESLAIRDRVVDELTKLGLNQDQLASATKFFDHFVGFDLFYDLARVVNEHTPEGERNAASLCFNWKSGPIGEDRLAGDIKTCLAKIIPIEGEVAEAISDLAQFQRDKTLRRRDVYVSRGGG